MIERLGVRTLTKLTHHLHDVHPASCAENAVNPRDLDSHFGTVTLRETTRRDQNLTLALALCQLAQHIDRLLLGWADKSAGVNNQHAGARRIFDSAITVANKKLGHRVGVNGI